jgi:hypothetical protein
MAFLGSLRKRLPVAADSVEIRIKMTCGGAAARREISFAATFLPMRARHARRHPRVVQQ